MLTTAYAAERVRQKALMAVKRAIGRDLDIPAVHNPRRRRRCERNPELFMRTYMPVTFKKPFSEDQRELITCIVNRLRYGGWQSVAAPRGEGKTSIVRGTAMWAISDGLVRYLMWIAANAREAERRSKETKAEYETNEVLAEDFPEICIPIRALEGAAQRANQQTVDGKRTRLTWSGEMIIMPTVPGSKASGAILETRGIEGAIRGAVYLGVRPDLVILDDIETRESIMSLTETAGREATIDTDIVGLAGPGARTSIVYLCSIMRRNCLADRYTDRAQRPAWHGLRRRMLIDPPTHQDLWTRFIELRHQSQLVGDDTGRASHGFYLDNQDQMDAGSKMCNPFRFRDEVLPDGSQVESSALEACYNIIADIGPSAWATEYQNEPPKEDAPETAGLSIPTILSPERSNGLPRGTVPAGAELITAGVDVSGRVLHWVVLAWKAGAAAYVDYGTTRVHSPLEGRITAEENRPALQKAILDALLEFRELAAAGWPEQTTGEVRPLNLSLVDAGWQDEPVYEFVRCSPRGLFRASKGFGSGSGQARYHHPVKKGHGRLVGTHWHATRQPAAKCWLYNLDSDHWKTFVHNGFLTTPPNAGSFALFGSDPVKHRLLAEHLTAEVFTREWQTGRGYREYWDQRHRDNHWLDATAMASAAAGVLGLKILEGRPAVATHEKAAPSRQRPAPPPSSRPAPEGQRPPRPEAAELQHTSSDRGSHPPRWIGRVARLTR